MGNEESNDESRKGKLNDEEDCHDIEELLQLYLSLSIEERKKKFVSTAVAATMIGRAQRTIQFWIETGAIQAIPIGNCYQVNIDSLTEYLKNQISKKLY